MVRYRALLFQFIIIDGFFDAAEIFADVQAGITFAEVFGFDHFDKLY